MASVIVDVELDDFTDNELIEEIKARGKEKALDNYIDCTDIKRMLDALEKMGYPKQLISEMKDWEHCPWLFPVRQMVGSI